MVSAQDQHDESKYGMLLILKRNFQDEDRTSLGELSLEQQLRLSDHDHVHQDRFKQFLDYSKVYLKPDLHYFDSEGQNLPNDEDEYYTSQLSQYDGYQRPQLDYTRMHGSTTSSLRGLYSSSDYSEDTNNEGYERWDIQAGPGYVAEGLGAQLMSQLKFTTTLDNPKYKNNLADFSVEHPEYMFYGSASRINVFRIGSNGAAEGNPVYTFELAPLEVPVLRRLADLRASVWSLDPYTVNFLKVSRFCGKEVLVSAMDGGRVLIWNVEDILDAIKQHEQSQANEGLGSNTSVNRIHVSFELRTSKLAWGVDLNDELKLVVVSDNSWRVYFYKLDETHQKFYSAVSLQLESNVPDVAIIMDLNRDCNNFSGRQEVHVLAASVSGELVVLSAKISPVRKGLDPDVEMTDATKANPVSRPVLICGDFTQVDKDTVISEPRVVSRTVLKENAWTVNYIDGRYFKKCNTLLELTGNPRYPEYSTVKQIAEQSQILDGELDPVHSSDLGIAARFACFHSSPSDEEGKSVLSRDKANLYLNQLKEPGTALSDSFSRLQKFYEDYYVDTHRGKSKQFSNMEGGEFWAPVASTRFHNQLLLATTENHLGLFHTNRLVCNSYTSPVFRQNNDEGCNRISFVKLVPELSCVVIATQVGALAIYRLNTYRGLFSFREVMRLPAPECELRELLGLAIRHLEDEFFIHLVYYDGATLTFRLYEEGSSDLGILL